MLFVSHEIRNIYSFITFEQNLVSLSLAVYLTQNLCFDWYVVFKTSTIFFSLPIRRRLFQLRSDETSTICLKVRNRICFVLNFILVSFLLNTVMLNPVSLVHSTSMKKSINCIINKKILHSKYSNYILCFNKHTQINNQVSKIKCVLRDFSQSLMELGL